MCCFTPCMLHNCHNNAKIVIQIGETRLWEIHYSVQGRTHIKLGVGSGFWPCFLCSRFTVFPGKGNHFKVRWENAELGFDGWTERESASRRTSAQSSFVTLKSPSLSWETFWPQRWLSSSPPVCSAHPGSPQQSLLECGQSWWQHSIHVCGLYMWRVIVVILLALSFTFILSFDLSVTLRVK